MRSQQHMPFDNDAIAEALRDPVTAPDQKRAIMGRLGYMRVDPMVARRRRYWAAACRLGCLAAIVTAGLIGFGWYNATGDFRQPAETTLPSAFASQVERQQSVLTGLMESIRRPQVDFVSREHGITPQPITDEPVEVVDESDLLLLPQDEPAEMAVGPYRWT